LPMCSSTTATGSKTSNQFKDGFIRPKARLGPLCARWASRLDDPALIPTRCIFLRGPARLRRACVFPQKLRCGRPAGGSVQFTGVRAAVSTGLLGPSTRRRSSPV
jgi:hypothetical protein